MKSQARVVIVGGGMMGVGLLYHLAKEGWTDVVLVEKGELTSGSTWHSAGQCPSFIGDYTMAMVHHVSNSLYPKLEQLTGQYTSWHGCGGIRLATQKAELEWFKHVSDIAKHIGYRMEVIGPDEIRRINPFLDTTEVIAGAWTLDDGHVDPAGTCNAMAKGARDMGASIVRNNRVTDINLRRSGEWEVVTQQGAIIAEHVVNAAGCYARMVSQMVDSDAPIWNTEHQYFITEPIEEFIHRDEEIPVVRDPSASCYYRQEQKSALIGVYETAAAVGAWRDSGGLPAWDSQGELFQPDYDRVLPHFERVMERMPIFCICSGFPVYAFHIRKLGRIIVNPDVHVVEQRDAQRRQRRVPQRRHPEQQKTIRVHPIARKPEDPLPHERHRPVCLIEMINTEGARETEVTFY